MSDPKNTVLVTGAAMGIGKAVAENLVAAGKSVVLMDVNGDALAETVQTLGPRAVASVGSVANAADSDAKAATQQAVMSADQKTSLANVIALAAIKKF